MRNKDRDEEHWRRREAGCGDDTPNGKAVAEALYGGNPSALEEEPEREIVVKRQNLSGYRTPCAICGEEMETRAGPWLHLDIPFEELSYPRTSDVCKKCGLREDPETVKKMEEERASWISTWYDTDSE